MLTILDACQIHLQVVKRLVSRLLKDLAIKLSPTFTYARSNQLVYEVSPSLN